MLNIWNKEFISEPLEGKNPRPILETACELMDSLGGLYWVSYGTALGLYRDNGFIPHDTDIDITAMSNTIDYKKVIATFTGAGFDLIRTSTNSETGIVYQTAFIHTESNIVVDIDYVELFGDKLITEAEYSGHIEFPITMLDSVGQWFIEINGECIQIPLVDPPKYLEYVYGKDWKTPKSKSETIYSIGDKK